MVEGISGDVRACGLRCLTSRHPSRPRKPDAPFHLDLRTASRRARPCLARAAPAYAFWCALAALRPACWPWLRRTRRAWLRRSTGSPCTRCSRSAVCITGGAGTRWRPLLADSTTARSSSSSPRVPRRSGVLVLTGPARTAVLLAVWLGAAAGVAMSVVWIDAPRGVSSPSATSSSGAQARQPIPQSVGSAPGRRWSYSEQEHLLPRRRRGLCQPSPGLGRGASASTGLPWPRGRRRRQPLHRDVGLDRPRRAIDAETV